MLTLQLFDNFENDTLRGRSRGGGWVPHGGGGLVFPSSGGRNLQGLHALLRSDGGRGDGASVYPSSKHRGKARSVPLHLLWAYLPVSNGNSLIVLYLVTCLFIQCVDYKSLGGVRYPRLGLVLVTPHLPSP
ncbi:hypothetical protein HJG60_012082 [Phyllostomus discolor]|uniref:Uncharacterized protein n=1 Tax=Phyllostomus discolor TaxID=89673 RepID=A0A834DT53_9CHIR|nr:hypothetical protein HJG60_012082 [Phyllostomus discolor]